MAIFGVAGVVPERIPHDIERLAALRCQADLLRAGMTSFTG